MSDTDLSSRIRQRREQLGLSQEELAARMGYRSKSSITKLEKGINDLPRAKLEELAAALDTTPAWLMGLSDLPCPPPGFEPLPEMVRRSCVRAEDEGRGRHVLSLQIGRAHV